MVDDLLRCEACGEEVLDIDVRCRSCGHRLASTGAQSLIGSVMLEHYEIVDILGQGGMSVVYLARHKLTEQKVALKILPPELAAHSQVKSRFLDEARALAALDHPNIVHLYNFGQEAGCFVLAMQFVEGETWERKILEDENLPWEYSCRVAIDVVKALEYAHKKGIIHRDMKPSNVLIRDLDGSATVMDFGIAKMTDSTRLTATGQTMGTVRYMSPEQVRGLQVDHRTDIYSLGATLYEAVVGDTPFDGETHFEIMTKHLNEPPKLPSSLGIDVPPAFERVLMRTLAKKAEDRYQSAEDFRRALEAALENREFASVTAPMTAPELGAKAPAGRAQSKLTGIASALEPSGEQPALGEASVVSEPGAGKPLLWIAVAAIAVIGGVVGVMILQRGDDKPAAKAQAPAKVSDAGAAAPAPVPRWPEPFVLPGLKFAADKKFSDGELRVMSVDKRDLGAARNRVAAAQRAFINYLKTKQVVAKVDRSPLNVQFVPKWVICDPRVHKGMATRASDCMRVDHTYRPPEKTLLIAEKASHATMREGVAEAICTSSVSPDAFDRCLAAMTAFLTDSMVPPHRRNRRHRGGKSRRGKRG